VLQWTCQDPSRKPQGQRFGMDSISLAGHVISQVGAKVGNCLLFRQVLKDFRIFALRNCKKLQA